MLTAAIFASTQLSAHHRVVVRRAPRPVIVHNPAPVVVVRPTPIASAVRLVSTAVIVASLPANHTTIVHCGTPYYCHSGIYYIKVDEGYKQVEPPKSIIVYSLPDGATKVSKNSQVQYIHNNTIYEPIVTDEGMGYKIVGVVE